MKRYLKLSNFEFNRFFKIYLVLIGITFVMQMAGVISESNSYMGRMEEGMLNGSTQEEALMQWGTFSFLDVTRSIWFSAPIAICIVSLLIYVLFIWYRDWFGKNTFAYRLLMLPTARINVFFAKATAIFLMVLGLVALQLVFILLENALMKSLVPDLFREDLSLNQIITGFDYIRVIYPTSFIQFVINYGIGFMTVFVVFTGIIMERSFRWKGIILGVIYAGISFAVFIAPILIQTFVLVEFFYPIELFILMVMAGLVVIAGSIWMSHYLLNKKIRV